jgi:hypothetical protein
VLFLISTIPETFLGDKADNREQLSFLVHLPNSPRFRIKNPGTNLNLNLV